MLSKHMHVITHMNHLRIILIDGKIFRQLLLLFTTIFLTLDDRAIGNSKNCCQNG
jgi:hypothetical protein